MKHLRLRWRPLTLSFITAVLLCACHPTLNWREVRGADDASYSVLLPAKPTGFTRPVDLNGTQVTMSMTAAEVDEISYAVASAVIADAVQAQQALATMQAAMLKNIAGTLTAQRSVTIKGGGIALEIEATGQAGRVPRNMRMAARFVRHGDRVYQAVVLGPADTFSAEAAETFLGSLTLH